MSIDTQQSLAIALATAKLPIKVVDGVEYFRYGDMAGLLRNINPWQQRKQDDVKKSPAKISNATK